MKKSILTASLTVIVFVASYAQVELLKDINYTATQTSQTTIELEDPEDFIALGNKTIFRAYDDTHGWQLWVTDNTHEGTYLLKELSSSSAEPTSFTLLNNLIYFAAGTGNNGRELWKTDGTTEGTVVVADINPGGGSGLNFPDFLTEVNDTLYFRADDGTGNALWKSDGTAPGTVKIKTLVFDTSSAGPFRFPIMDNVIYFNAFDDDHGYELWKSDGTADGTVMVKDLAPGPDFGFPRTITLVNDEIFFVGFSAIDGALDLWKSDGTAGGTVLVKSIPSENGSYPTELISAAGLLFFTSDDDVAGRELWRTDGTPAGTYMINKKSSADRKASFPVDLNGTVYFVSADANGNELWKTDGTVSGTVPVKDIQPGPLPSSPAGLTPGENILYFVADDGVTGEALWQSDGTEGGTTLVKDIGDDSDIKNLAYVNDVLYFHADDGTGSNTRLWMYDPSEASAVNLGYRFTYDIDYSVSGDPYDFVKVNEVTYFIANDGVHGEELWKTDGTPSGTSLVKDINAGSADSFPGGLTPADGLLFFVADDGIHGGEVWKTDGTPGGTMMVKDIIAGPESPNPLYLTFNNGIVFFSAQEDIAGVELWKTDGTESGTVMVKDIYPGDEDSDPYNLTSVGNTLYFVAYDDIHFTGLGIWKSDGTESGTVMVNNADSPISAVNYSFDDYYFVRGMNETFYFSTYTTEFGDELWKSDGTDEGTVLVKDINPGPGSATIDQLIVLNGVLYFQADDGVHGFELWKTDGTEAGTVLVKDINPGSASASVWAPTVANNLLFFSAYEDGDLYLWRTDGTTEGTFPIESNDAGPDIEQPASFTSAGDQLLFSTYDPALSQHHLWRTDGSACGTIWLSAGDPEGIYILDMTFSGNRVLIAGEISGSGHGEELYTYDMSVMPPGPCQFISFDPIPQKTYGDIDFVLTASASSGLPVQYSSSDPAVVSITNNVVTILSAGSTTITASQPGNSSFNPAEPVSQLLTINKAQQTISLLSIPNKTEGDVPFAVIATSTSGLPVTISSSSQKIALAAGTITILHPGRVAISASQTGNEFYEAAEVAETDFCINPTKPLLTIAGSSAVPIIESSSALGNQWFLNSVAIADEDEASIEVKEEGVYTAIVTYDDCTSESSEPLEMFITAVSPEFGKTATVFPNPATNSISIQLNSLRNSAENIIIMDLKGLTKDVTPVQGRSEIEVDISGYTSGAYILLINSRELVFSKVFIKK